MSGAYITPEEWKGYRVELVERIELINIELLKLINKGVGRSDKRYQSLEFRRENAERRLINGDTYFNSMSLREYTQKFG